MQGQRPARTAAKGSVYKPQARTAATKSKILDAALRLFSERGFDNSNLDLVALEAGCSRGAIYAHYASKEELFLDLFEQRLATLFHGLCLELEAEPEHRRRLAIFKRWLLEQLQSPHWGVLTLEFKLYAARRPESRDRLLELYRTLPSGVAESSFDRLLFGPTSDVALQLERQRRVMVLSSMVSGAILERQLRPEALPGEVVRKLAGELFDMFMNPLLYDSNTQK